MRTVEVATLTEKRKIERFEPAPDLAAQAQEAPPT
jgi:hypothetical protein